MSKIVRLVLPGTVLVILVGAIAYGAPRKESFTSGRSESWFHRTFVTRRTKAHAQTQATSLPARDAQAVSLANQAVTALVGNTMITDATVQGTASYIAGSDQETGRSEEHTSELQSLTNLVCRLLLEKKNRFSKSTAVRLG